MYANLHFLGYINPDMAVRSKVRPQHGVSHHPGNKAVTLPKYSAYPFSLHHPLMREKGHATRGGEAK